VRRSRTFSSKLKKDLDVIRIRGRRRGGRRGGRRNRKRSFEGEEKGGKNRSRVSVDWSRRGEQESRGLKIGGEHFIELGGTRRRAAKEGFLPKERRREGAALPKINKRSRKRDQGENNDGDGDLYERAERRTCLRKRSAGREIKETIRKRKEGRHK